MCIGIPMQVERTERARAWCRGRNGAAWIDLALVGDVDRGAWLLTHLGAAREVIDDDRARVIDQALDALDAVLNGADDAQRSIDAAFADLVGREPQLPPHLQNKETNEWTR